MDTVVSLYVFTDCICVLDDSSDSDGLNSTDIAGVSKDAPITTSVEPVVVPSVDEEPCTSGTVVEPVVVPSVDEEPCTSGTVVEPVVVPSVDEEPCTSGTVVEPDVIPSVDEEPCTSGTVGLTEESLLLVQEQNSEYEECLRLDREKVYYCTDRTLSVVQIFTVDRKGSVF